MHIAKAPEPGEAAELWTQRHQDSLKDYILRDQMRHTFITLSAEAFEAAFWCYEKLRGK